MNSVMCACYAGNRQAKVLVGDIYADCIGHLKALWGVCKDAGEHPTIYVSFTACVLGSWPCCGIEHWILYCLKTGGCNTCPLHGDAVKGSTEMDIWQ